MKKRNGFTVVELVIVIAVIAVLAAVLIPTFRGITDKAEESTALADSKVSYEEYLTKTLPENIDKNLYVQVNNGFVRFEDGKAEKTGESYITTINEAHQWIDKKGNYRDAFYLTTDALAEMFLEDCNVILNTNFDEITDYMGGDTNWFKPWQNANFFNKWSWILEFLREYAKKNGRTTEYFDNLISEKAGNTEGGGYAYALQNIAIFFLRINASIWDEKYWDGVVGSQTDLPSNWTTLDCTGIVFGDYAPFIPYDLFASESIVGKENLLDEFANIIVSDFNNIGADAVLLTVRENFKSTSHPNIKYVWNNAENLNKYKWFFKFALEEITNAANNNMTSDHEYYRYAMETKQMLEEMISGDINAIGKNSSEGIVGYENARTLFRYWIEGLINAKLARAEDIYEKCMVDYSVTENMRRFIAAYIDSRKVDLPTSNSSNIPDDAIVVNKADNSAYQSLSAALAVATEGQKIYLYPGTYSEELTITIPNISIIGPNSGIRGQDSSARSEEAVISKITTISARNVKLDGLKFSASIKVGANNATITNCCIVPNSTVKCRDTNRQGCIVDSADISELTVSYNYIECPGTAQSYTNQFMSFYNVNNLTIIGNYITNKNHTTEVPNNKGNIGQYLGMRIYNCSGTMNITNNEFYFGTTGYLMYIGDSSNNCTAINIIDNIINSNGVNNISDDYGIKNTTAGILIENGKSSLIITIRGNEIYNCCGSTLLFYYHNSSKVKIQYNLFGEGTEYKENNYKGSNNEYTGIIIEERINNYYVEKQKTTTTDYDTYTHDESGLTSYIQAYENYKG